MEFAIDQKVKVKSSGETGTVIAYYPAATTGTPIDACDVRLDSTKTVILVSVNNLEPTQ